MTTFGKTGATLLTCHWPKYSAENFELLEKAGLITAEMSAQLQAGNGMRNIMLHQHKKINLTLVVRVVEEHLDSLLQHGEKLSRLAPDEDAS